LDCDWIWIGFSIHFENWIWIVNQIFVMDLDWIDNPKNQIEQYPALSLQQHFTMTIPICSLNLGLVTIGLSWALNQS